MKKQIKELLSSSDIECIQLGLSFLNQDKIYSKEWSIYILSFNKNENTYKIEKRPEEAGNWYSLNTVTRALFIEHPQLNQDLPNKFFEVYLDFCYEGKN